MQLRAPGAGLFRVHRTVKVTLVTTFTPLSGAKKTMTKIVKLRH